MSRTPSDLLKRAIGDLGWIKPSEARIRAWAQAPGMGITDVLFIVKLLRFIWPKGKKDPGGCVRLVNGKRCSAPFVHSEKGHGPEGETLILICEKHHQTVKLMSAIR